MGFHESLQRVVLGDPDALEDLWKRYYHQLIVRGERCRVESRFRCDPETFAVDTIEYVLGMPDLARRVSSERDLDRLMFWKHRLLIIDTYRRNRAELPPLLWCETAIDNDDGDSRRSIYDLLVADGNVEDGIEESWCRSVFVQALRELPQEPRTALICRFGRSIDWRRAMQMLQIPKTTYYRLANSAMEQLRQVLYAQDFFSACGRHLLPEE